MGVAPFDIYISKFFSMIGILELSCITYTVFVILVRYYISLTAFVVQLVTTENSFFYIFANADAVVFNKLYKH